MLESVFLRYIFLDVCVRSDIGHGAVGFPPVEHDGTGGDESEQGSDEWERGWSDAFLALPH